MLSALTFPNEDKRVSALKRYCVLDTPPDVEFDRFAHIARVLLQVPAALVSLVDSDRVWFKSHVGLDVCETPREFAFCNHAVSSKDVLVVSDAVRDVRFSGYALVTRSPAIRAYFGAPLIDVDGLALGTICGVDYVPRSQPAEATIDSLRHLAGCVVAALKQRTLVHEFADRERALREKSQLLQTTIDAAGQGISAFDADLKLVARNAKFLELLDLPPQLGRIGTPFDAISSFVAAYGGYGPGDADVYVANRKDAVSRGIPHRLEIVRTNGRLTEVRGFPVLGGGRVTTYTDITEQRRHADELLRQLAEREEITKLKNEFISVVSHELRTPLTAIAGSLQFLKSGKVGALTEASERMVGIAFDNSQRLIRLVNDILDIDKMEAGRATFDMKPCGLAPLIARAIAETEPFADRFDVRIEFQNLAGDAIAVVDPDKFIQVVTNLLSNAAKFSLRGGTVTVTIDRSETGLRVSVRDRGHGIPSDFQGRIFEKFSQADGSDKRHLGGSGLGLVIVKTIVEDFDGQVSFETEQGRGTTFHVRLPEWHAQ